MKKILFSLVVLLSIPLHSSEYLIKNEFLNQNLEDFEEIEAPSYSEDDEFVEIDLNQKEEKFDNICSGFSLFFESQEDLNKFSENVNNFYYFPGVFDSFKDSNKDESFRYGIKYNMKEYSYLSLEQVELLLSKILEELALRAKAYIYKSK